MRRFPTLRVELPTLPHNLCDELFLDIVAFAVPVTPKVHIWHLLVLQILAMSVVLHLVASVTTSYAQATMKKKSYTLLCRLARMLSVSVIDKELQVFQALATCCKWRDAPPIQTIPSCVHRDHCATQDFHVPNKTRKLDTRAEYERKARCEMGDTDTDTERITDVSEI